MFGNRKGKDLRPAGIGGVFDVGLRGFLAGAGHCHRDHFLLGYLVAIRFDDHGGGERYADGNGVALDGDGNREVS